MTIHEGKWSGRGRLAARIVLGLIFFVFGLNGFLQFLPQPPLPAKAIPFVTGMASTGYFFPLLKGAEVLAALLLLTNRAVPLALVILAPIVLNIVAFHLVLAPGGSPLALFVLALELYAAWTYREAFAPLFSRKEIGATTARPAPVGLAPASRA